jgi:hypothetical protein
MRIAGESSHFVMLTFVRFYSLVFIRFWRERQPFSKSI